MKILRFGLKRASSKVGFDGVEAQPNILPCDGLDQTAVVSLTSNAD
jgi:hypothetical protein